MSSVLNFAGQSSPTQGQGPYTIDSAANAAPGARTLVSAAKIETRNAVGPWGIHYLAQDSAQFELGFGILTQGGNYDFLTRERIFLSSIGRGAVNWGPGRRDIVSFPEANIARGYLAQYQETIYTTNTSGTTDIGQDDTIPQNTEGTQITTVSITPTSRLTYMNVYAQVYMDTVGGTEPLLHALLFRDSDADALTMATRTSTGGTPQTLNFFYREQARTMSAITYKLRVGKDSNNPATTWYVNRLNTTSNPYGASKLQTRLSVEETWI